MFEKASKKLVEQIQNTKGTLIAASSPNDSKHLKLLAVVQKKILKGWIWQQTKYRPTSFILSDLLIGDPIEPVCKKEPSVEYGGTYINTTDGSIDIGVAALNLNMNAKCRTKLCLSLGKLQTEYVVTQTLLNVSKGRKLDLNHPLLLKSRSRNKTFTLIIERIVTTCNSSICCTELEKGGCFAIFGGRCAEMVMEDSGNLRYNSETALDIPPDTVMAYSVLEMTIDSDGYFDFCHSEIEDDDIPQDILPILSEVDGQKLQIQEGSPLDTLKNALADVQTSFCALTDLSTESRSSILHLLRKILLDRPVLSALVDGCESSGETPFFLTSELSEEQTQIIGAFLDLLKCEPLDKNGLSISASLSGNNGCQKSTANHSDLSLTSELNGSSRKPEERNGCHTAVSHQNMKLTSAMQMLISALEELTDAGLKLLEPFCTSEGLKNLQDLVIQLTSNYKPLCKVEKIPVFLQNDDEFHRAEALFKSCNVLLKKKKDTLSSEITCREGFLPLVLCIAIHGLASLSG